MHERHGDAERQTESAFKPSGWNVADKRIWLEIALHLFDGFRHHRMLPDKPEHRLQAGLACRAGGVDFYFQVIFKLKLDPEVRAQAAKQFRGKRTNGVKQAEASLQSC